MLFKFDLAQPGIPPQFGVLLHLGDGFRIGRVLIEAISVECQTAERGGRRFVTVEIVIAGA